ncbi:hypothetical protein HPP92_014771 [Vanilla planifolia]|uniref:Uncharacterized protein n=1 Tax=Vanilla planifolia TaxID=51239 RepID=A0A835QKM5_VANPL|nr:hypothetical protein HPP92_014771 [Vanilla planifolia]
MEAEDEVVDALLSLSMPEDADRDDLLGCPNTDSNLDALRDALGQALSSLHLEEAAQEERFHTEKEEEDTLQLHIRVAEGNCSELSRRGQGEGAI